MFNVDSDVQLECVANDERGGAASKRQKFLESDVMIKKFDFRNV